jgi:hypothetical protein
MSDLIPTDRFTEALESVNKKWWLSKELRDIDENALYRIRNKSKRISFDFADKILCKLDLVNLWYEPLKDIYESLDLSKPSRHDLKVLVDGKRCAKVGCANVFIPGTPQGGGRPQRFCSTKCRISAQNKRRVEAQRLREGRQPRYGNPNDTCINGHDCSPENTYISPQGKRLCRGCMRDNARRTRQRKRETLLVAA